MTSHDQLKPQVKQYSMNSFFFLQYYMNLEYLGDGMHVF